MDLRIFTYFMAQNANNYVAPCKGIKVMVWVRVGYTEMLIGTGEHGPQTSARAAV